MALFRTARDVLVAEQSSGRTGLAPLSASSHLLVGCVEKSMEEKEEGCVCVWGVMVVHLSES